MCLTLSWAAEGLSREGSVKRHVGDDILKWGEETSCSAANLLEWREYFNLRAF